MAGQLEFELRETPRRVALTVSQLLRVVRETLDVQLAEYWVAGEVSNARMAPSNHLYFTLKDARGAINAVMFSSASRRLRFRVVDGMQIVVRGRVNIYEVRGTLQLYAEEIEPRGLGALQLAFEQLKQRLSREGLFDAAVKRPLPRLPRTLGIVTALGGAALRDLLRILLDRYPNLHIIIRPSVVQGAGAAAELARAIDDLSFDGRAEVVIVGRGGGSLEDLWPFNEEVVARAIRRSTIPIVSAVGHEIDYTIADFVADLRAPTPSAAAQLVVPIKAEVRQRLDAISASITGATRQTISGHRRHLAHLMARLRDPETLIRQARQRLDDATAELAKALQTQVEAGRSQVRELTARLMNPVAWRATVAARRARVAHLRERLDAGMRMASEGRRAQLGAAAQRLDAVSPLRVLERGYAVVTQRSSGRVVSDADQVAVGDELRIRLARGGIRANVAGRDL
ncbi:MAG: exodeoxyribonuclease VII large subunit [Candidatus Binataceae bacterium]